ncbi:MAG: hypothetical protein EOO88_52705 [Pedobacter sp.]|nr:MAG: hypothetical protein EOO88_52705 [Pedobacter sp.]
MENYSVGIQLESSYFDETGAALVNALDDKDASFGKSANSWSNYVYKNIYFPSNFKFVNADKAVVVVSFEIDEAGNVVNPFVSTPFYPDFDKIALTAVKRSPPWKPAISHNRKVRTRFRQIVTFSQE